MDEPSDGFWFICYLFCGDMRCFPQRASTVRSLSTVVIGATRLNNAALISNHPIILGYNQCRWAATRIAVLMHRGQELTLCQLRPVWGCLHFRLFLAALETVPCSELLNTPIARRYASGPVKPFTHLNAEHFRNLNMELNRGNRPVTEPKFNHNAKNEENELNKGFKQRAGPSLVLRVPYQSIPRQEKDTLPRFWQLWRRPSTKSGSSHPYTKRSVTSRKPSPRRTISGPVP